jgi:hypothetical protein
LPDFTNIRNKVKELIELDKHALEAALHSLHRQRENVMGFVRADSIAKPSTV